MDIPNCTWSGGFEVNKPKSFHVNMRWAPTVCRHINLLVNVHVVFPWCQSPSRRSMFPYSAASLMKFTCSYLKKLPFLFKCSAASKGKIQKLKWYTTVEFLCECVVWIIWLPCPALICVCYDVIRSGHGRQIHDKQLHLSLDEVFRMLHWKQSFYWL